MAEASLPPSVASVICEAFADGGPMDNVAWGFNASRNPDDWPDVLSDGANGLLALAERASGDEREDLLAMATAVDDFTMAWGTSYSPDEFWNLPQETRDALEAAIQDAHEALTAAEPAFYLKYAERCDLEQNAPTVDCGPADRVTCDRIVADLIAGYRQAWEDGSYEEGHGPPRGLPVTGVVILGLCPGGGTSHLETYWPGGGIVSQSLCGGGDPLPTPTAIVGSPEVGVPYQVALHDCMVDFPLGDTWWRFENAGPTAEPIIPDTVGTVHGVVTLTSPDTAILRPGDGSELMLIRVDEPTEGRCY
jgi:hypothetical protein